MNLSIMYSGSFWTLLLVTVILLIIFLVGKRSSRKRLKSHTRKTTGKIEFIEWLKPNLEKATFPTAYPNKEHLKSHIYDLVMDQWRLQYVIDTGNATLINNVPKVIDEIVKFLIDKEKITFEKSTSS